MEDVDNAERAVEADARDFTVFIHTTGAPAATALARLATLGVPPAAGADARVFTARLSARELDTLSAEPWVARIRLARRLRPADDPPL